MNAKLIFLFLFTAFALAFSFYACTPKTPKTPELERPEALQKFIDLANDPSSNKNLAAQWQHLIKSKQIPFVWNETNVAFLYQGRVDEVWWNGDFNAWGRKGMPKYKGKRLGESNYWICETTFPKDARLDYKIVADGEWMVDPNNANQQWAGIGGGQPNSELQMPAWKPEKWAEQRAHFPISKVSQNFSLGSWHMGYPIQYKVYTPADYENLKDLSVIYVLDGQEYSNPKMGAMTHHLDNLIAAKQIEPVIAVFIDPRNPEDLTDNRRENEFRFNEKFIDFITKELIPEIEGNYYVLPNRENRALLGTSYGGLCTAYAGVKANETFSKLGINSPAFWYQWPSIKGLYSATELEPCQVVMTTGTFYDGQEQTEMMKKTMEEKGFQMKYLVVNEGHSWGNWKGLLDDILIEFYGL